MLTLKRYPFIWITGSYVMGLILSDALNFQNIQDLNLIWLMLPLPILFFFRISSTFLFAFSLVTIVLSAFTYKQFQNDHYKQKIDSGLTERKHLLTGIIKSKKNTEKYVRTIVDLSNEGDKHKFPPKLLLYIPKRADQNIKLKDTITFYGNIDTIHSSSNPYSFDFRKHMNKQNLNFQCFINDHNYKILPSSNKYDFKLHLNHLNETMSKIIDEKIQSSQNAALLKAIFLGNKSSLSADTLLEFSNTGSRHILAVSGMHVGIILSILIKIFRLWRTNRLIMKIARDVVIISIIWVYAFLTGAQPAVIRASFMLSILFIGKFTGSGVWGINALFFSAFVLLLTDPSLIYQLSFIFSYVAMLSIFIFFKPVYSWIKTDNHFLNYALQLIALSIAAQILMLPVAVYFFHKIPLLFIASGLITTPLAYIIILFLILFFLDHFLLGLLDELFIFILDKASFIFLHSISYLDKLPFGTLDDIYIGDIGLILLLIAVYNVFAGLKNHSKKMIFVGFFSGFLFLTLQGYEIIKIRHQYLMTIYDDRKSTFIDVFIKGKCYFWQSGDPDEIQIKFIASGNRIRHGIKTLISLNENKLHHEKIQFHKNTGTIFNKIICILAQKSNYLPDVKEIDFLIIDHFSHDRLQSILENYTIHRIVISKKITHYDKKQIEKFLVNYPGPVTVWDIAKQGAFQINLNDEK